MPQNDVRQTFKSNQFRREEEVRNDLMAVEFRDEDPDDMMDNPLRVWANKTDGELKYSVDGVNIQGMGTKAQIAEINAQLADIVTVDIKNYMKNEETLDVAITNALADITEGKILIPNGTYNVANSIIITKSNIVLEFGNNAKINFLSKNITCLIIEENLSNIKILNGQFYGSADSSASSYAISFKNYTSDIEVSGNRFDGFTGGIMLMYQNEKVVIERNAFYNMVYVPTESAGGYGVVCQSSIGTRIINNYFDGTVSRHHIYMGRNPLFTELPGYNNVISDNVFTGKNETTYETGYEFLVKIMGNQNVTVSNNVFDGGLGHVWLTADGTADAQPQNITISNNVFRNIEKGNSLASAVIGSNSEDITTIIENVTIANNTIIDCDCIAAIRLEIAINLIISGNSIKDVTDRGIIVDYEIKKSTIANNIIDGASRAIQIGSSESSTYELEDILITSNLIRNVSFGIFFNYVISAIVENNDIETLSFQSIYLNSGVFEGIIRNNKFNGGNNGITITSNNNKNIFCYGNIFGTHSTNAIENVPNVYLLEPFSVLGIRKNLKTYGSSAPATGSWSVGDRVFNNAPAASEYDGWVCTVSGTPGTWKGFGMIES